MEFPIDHGLAHAVIGKPSHVMIGAGEVLRYRRRTAAISADHRQGVGDVERQPDLLACARHRQRAQAVRRRSVSAPSANAARPAAAIATTSSNSANPSGAGSIARASAS